MRSGTLLRGEVLARWHEVVGTGDLMRALETRVGWVRDRLRSLRHRQAAPPTRSSGRRCRRASTRSCTPPPTAPPSGSRAAGADSAGGAPLLAGRERLDAASPGLADATAEEVRGWQGYVFDLVREESAGKRTTARLASLGVNGAGLTVMIAVFASTGGLTGAEVVVAGGTSALGQKVLEAVFGDQAVRALAARAREELLGRVRSPAGRRGRALRRRAWRP